jgi:hypothetical protein
MLDYDGREAVAQPFGRSLREAITWMLIDAEGLMTAFERGDVHGALYVGVESIRHGDASSTSLRTGSAMTTKTQIPSSMRVTCVV